MRIANKYEVIIDENNITVKEISKVKKEDSKNFGTESTKDLGYFSSVENAYDFLLKKEIGKCELHELEVIYNKIIDFRDEVKREFIPEGFQLVCSDWVRHIEKYEEDSNKLAALRAYGVDNWEGYSLAMEEYEKTLI